MWLKPLLRRARIQLVTTAKVVFTLALFLGAATAVAYATVAWLIPAVVEHPYFRLKAVTISSDAELEAPEVLASRAGLFEGTSLWRIDGREAKSRLEDPAWVRRAEVHKRFPDRVSLQIYKRQPVAATIIHGAAFLVDGDGVVFREEQQGGERPDLPYLVGWQSAESQGGRIAKLRQLVDVATRAERLGLVASEIEIDERSELWLYPEMPRLTVKLGRADELPRAFERLEAVMADMADGAEEVRGIDLSYADRVVVRAAPGRLSKLIAGRGDASRAVAERPSPAAPRRVRDKAVAEQPEPNAEDPRTARGRAERDRG